jgi:hypothetical protein
MAKANDAVLAGQAGLAGYERQTVTALGMFPVVRR